MRPRTMMVMPPHTFEQQFGSEERELLATAADLVTPYPAADFNIDDSALAGVEVLLTSWGCPPITVDLLERMPKLRAIVHAAGSARVLVPDEAYSRGIQVTTAADLNAIPVAEFTLAATIFAGKRALPLAAQNRQEPAGWENSFADQTLSNYRRTIGVVGFSRIGRRFVELLRVLDVDDVLVFDPVADPDEVADAGATLAPLDEVLARAEILSLHAPLLPSTEQMIGARELALLPTGATLINTARGGIVDHEALLAECRTGRIDAILDVTDPEPLPVGHPLLELPNVTVTPHIAGSLGGETKRLAVFAVDAIRHYGATGVVPEALSAEKGKVSA